MKTVYFVFIKKFNHTIIYVLVYNQDIGKLQDDLLLPKHLPPGIRTCEKKTCIRDN